MGSALKKILCTSHGIMLYHSQPFIHNNNNKRSGKSKNSSYSGDCSINLENLVCCVKLCLLHLKFYSYLVVTEILPMPVIMNFYLLNIITLTSQFIGQSRHIIPTFNRADSFFQLFIDFQFKRSINMSVSTDDVGRPGVSISKRPGRIKSSFELQQ